MTQKEAYAMRFVLDMRPNAFCRKCAGSKPTIFNGDGKGQARVLGTGETAGKAWLDAEQRLRAHLEQL